MVIFILIPFGIGVLVGIISVAKIIKYCLAKFPEQTYSSITAFVLSSIVLIVYPLFGLECTVLELIIGIALLLIGSLISYKMEG